MPPASIRVYRQVHSPFFLNIGPSAKGFRCQKKNDLPFGRGVPIHTVREITREHGIETILRGKANIGLGRIGRVVIMLPVVVEGDEEGGVAVVVEEAQIRTPKSDLGKTLYLISPNTKTRKFGLSLLEGGKVCFIFLYICDFGVDTYDGKVVGTLKGHDALLNLVLDDVEEHIKGGYKQGE